MKSYLNSKNLKQEYKNTICIQIPYKEYNTFMNPNYYKNTNKLTLQTTIKKEKHSIQTKNPTTIEKEKQFNKRIKTIKKQAFLEFASMQKNAKTFEGLMLIHYYTNTKNFQNLTAFNNKDFKDFINKNKEQILHYKLKFSLQSLQHFTKEGITASLQSFIQDFINQMWLSQYEKSKQQYEKLLFLRFSDKYNSAYALERKTKINNKEQGVVYYPMMINNTFLSFNFTSMFVGGKLQTGSLGKKEALYLYHKDLSTQRVREYLLQKLVAYLCIDELRSKNTTLKPIKDMDFFHSYTYGNHLSTRAILLRLRCDTIEFKIPKYASQAQTQNIQKLNALLQELHKDEYRLAVYESYKRSADNGSSENALKAIDAYDYCMSYLDDVNEGSFNTNAKDNTPEPLKHRKFLRALDTIGQNNIKALYVGVSKENADSKEIKGDKDEKVGTGSNTNTNQNTSTNTDKTQDETEEKRPKVIGRLATTIIMKNGLFIG